MDARCYSPDKAKRSNIVGAVRRKPRKVSFALWMETKLKTVLISNRIVELKGSLTTSVKRLRCILDKKPVLRASKTC